MPDRRRLFRWMLGGTASLALGLPRATLQADDAVPLGAEDEWLDAIASRKQKAILDVRGFAIDGAPFRRALALVNVFTTTYAVAPADVGIAFGAHSSALGYLLSPAFWTEYDVAGKVAHSLRPDDAAALRKSGAAAASIGADGVRDLRAKGIRVLACRNTMARWSRDLAAVSKETPEAVLQKINANFHPGVEPVPAMIAAVVLAQARGVAYVAVE